jgi:hypothetical protein
MAIAAEPATIIGMNMSDRRMYARQLGLCLCALVAFFPASFGQTSAHKQVEAEVIGCEQRLADAERQHDSSVFKQLLREDLVYVVFNGWVFTKSGLISKMKYIDVNNYDPDNFKVRVPTPGSALITYDLNSKATVGGHDVPRKQYVSSLWVKSEGTWKLLFHQATPATHP